VIQGIVFSSVPIVLAGLVMVPQMGWMHPAVLNGTMPHPGVFAWKLGWGGPTGVVLGHLIYGLTLGALYTRPVGYAVRKQPKFKFRDKPAARRAPISDGDGSRSDFLFATGIECSCPTIDNGSWRMDQLDETGHYRHWRRDLELVRELGLRHLRYGPPLHLTWLGPDQYDWTFMDAVAEAMRELQIIPITDLCHFGLPAWLENFQNPVFPEHFAHYTAAFAQRYPWVELYTPVNEMYVTARMSALEGVWNEQLRSERGFVTAVKHLAKAGTLAAEAILRERPSAIFINSESSEFYQACCPDEDVVQIAEFENERRFIALDLLYGVRSSDRVQRYLLDHGMSAAEHEWFMAHGKRIAPHCILGVDYYEWNEKLINSDRKPESLGELFGWYVITKQYYDRYHRPLMHTETNSQDALRAPDWLWRQWHNVQLMRHSGVPVIGFTWYSLIDQVDWNIGLSRPLGNVNPVGLYDLNRDPRDAALTYRQLVKMFRNEPLVLGEKIADLPELLSRNGGVSSRPSSAPTGTYPAQHSVR
jgi:beta-glucosidase/6-phospho-beta-glucosidase/beta-galactosidase